MRRVAETMLAARFAGAGRVRLERVPVPVPGEQEILVQVHSCALCGSDRSGWTEGSTVTPGHEISGTVISTGARLAGPEPGTNGVIFLVDGCEKCASCLAGSPNRCLRKRAMYGFTAPGGLAEFVVVRSSCFLPVDKEIPLDRATALLDLFGTSSHAFRVANRPQMRSVLVIGCGPIGLGAVAVARALGARVVVASDVVPARLDLARRVGAIPVPAPVAEEATRDLAPGGFDVVIEAAGLASTQRRAIELTAAGGVAVFIAHSETPVEVRASTDLIAREVTLMGSEYFRPDEFPENHERVRSGVLDPGPMITQAFELERAGEACDLFFSGASGKVLVQP
jgi:threonine 3-dehydrogenase